MKQILSTKALFLGGLILTGLLQSCESSLDRIEDWEEGPANVSSNIKEVKAPEGFNFATTAESSFRIVAQDDETNEVMNQVGMQIFKQMPDGSLSLISKGATDINGIWQPQLTLPSYTDSLLVQVTGAGFPQWHRIGVGADQSTEYNLGAETNTTGRILEDPLEGPEDTSTGLNSGTLGARSGYSYLTTYSRLGKPRNLISRRTVSSDVLEFIASNLPESGNVPDANQNYLDDNFSSSVVFKQDGELWLSFAHEGAGYMNSVGYFVFDPENPPTDASEIDVRTVAFPNTSFRGSGGALKAGDRMYVGKFEKGTGVGWFLVPNGWNRSSRTVNESSSTRYSIDKLNTFTEEESRKHMVLLTNNEEEYFVLGIEDLNRPSGDNDFNDAVFLVDATPWGSVEVVTTPTIDPEPSDRDGDGVADVNDIYPLDPERAYTSYAPGQGNFGTIAYEDMWPRLGDYDFNDLVVDYSFIEILDAKERVKDIELHLQVRAMGASQNHGFSIRLPIDPQEIESVTGQVLTDDYVRIESNGTESGLSEAVIPVFTDGFALFSSVERGGIVNTDPERPTVSPGKIALKITFINAIDREKIGGAPYQPFMMRSQDRKREIHLAGNHPTEYADMTSFNTEADASNMDAGFYYVDENNLPWAIHVPESFVYPKEQTPINEVYANFADWATFGGTSSRGWYQDTGANVNSNKGF
ncbi:MAG: LruC domain-containing protein [Saprospiraceae bacterium]